MRPTRFLAALTVVGAFAALTLLATAANAQVPPPTLSGEHFEAALDITATCNPSGTSTVMFTASGIATGPYPGAFTEVGSATIGPQTPDPTGTSLTGTL